MKAFLKLWLLLGSLLILVTGCGYQWQSPGLLGQEYSSISVPYAEGDRDGFLTSALIHELASSNAGLAYRTSGGDLTLKVKLLDLIEENIGYHHERDADNNILKSIVPSESRLIATAEVTVEDARSGKIIMGPHRIAARTDYDYVFNSNSDNLKTFSMGQLEFADNAKDIAKRSLDKALAERVVEYITHSW
ncbi:MAG: LPS assembly lipoprotein LptE [Chlamydiota bacterium]